MRGVALGCAYSPCLTEFLREAVDAAVNFRRNIRVLYFFLQLDILY